MKHNRSSKASSAMSPSQALPKNGVDTVLAAFGKQLQPGQSVSFQLVKSHKALFHQVDPVNAKTAPPSDFPLIAKFPETVVRPDLTRLPWLTGRFYEQDHQTIIDEDDEDDAAIAAASEQRGQRKRRRWGSSNATQRQWVLQEEAEFAETMLARKERKSAPTLQGSSRYEATAEHNPSHYIMLELVPNSNSNNNTPVFQVTVLPTPYAVHTLSQPMARNAMSLTQAEQLLLDQRSHHMTRFMMHQNPNNTNNSNGIAHRTILPFSGLAAGRTNSSKSRLLGKLQQQHAASATAEDEDDDVMADVTFRNKRKGGGSRARKELITSMADESVRVDDEGVLGGTNDTEFGGKRHFGRVHVPTGASAAVANGADNAAAAGAATGAESMAMSNDFYQRDVQAEYDELDYDANEQFDDDDVDVGETEVAVDSRGFGGAGDDDDNDPDADDDDDEDEANHDVSTGGAEGLASLAGFRAMLAKARDRATSPTNAAGATGNAAGNAADANGGTTAAGSAAADDAKADGGKGNADDDGNSADGNMASGDNGNAGGAATDADAAPEGKKKKKDGGANNASNPHGDDDLAQIMAAAEKSAIAAKQKAVGSPDSKGGASKLTGMEVDDAGQRLVTLEAIRREIWLNHGSIAMKRLMKIFNIKKKSSAERQESFKSLVRELCNMIEDPVTGRKLVLKQHYAHMG